MDPAAGEYRGAIPALAEEELMGEDDEYEDLYNDVNVGEGIFQFHQTGASGSSNNFGNNGQAQNSSAPDPRREVDVTRDLGHAGVKMDKYQNSGVAFPEQKAELRVVQGSENVIHNPMGQSQTSAGRGSNPGNGLSMTVPDIPNNQTAASVNEIVHHNGGSDNIVRPPVENGSTMLFVGELHWWTTDAELEDALSQYGKVKEIKFFDERASGKSKGYCQVEFYESAAAAACKERMNGHVFNGRACAVAFASAQSLKQIGASSANKTQAQPLSQPLGRRNMNEGAGRGGGMNYPAGDGGRNYGRGGSWGRGQGGFNRGPGAGGPRGRGGQMAAKNSFMNPAGMGNGGVAGNYGQGMHGGGFGGAGNGMMHPQAMMGPGFDPSFMGRGAGYGSFGGHAFPGMMPPFQAVNTMGIPGVAPHVNPAFFGRGMAPNGMGMMGPTGMDGLMWGGDPSMGGGGWPAEDHAQRTRESSYGGDDGASEYGHGETNHEKGGRSNATSREKERSSQRDWPGNSEKRHRPENDQDWDDRSDRYKDHRSKERELGNEDDWDRGISSSSRSRSRTRAVPEDDHRSHSRDADYGKRRRAPE